MRFRSDLIAANMRAGPVIINMAQGRWMRRRSDWKWYYISSSIFLSRVYMGYDFQLN